MLLPAELDGGICGFLLLGELMLGDDRLFELGEGVIFECLRWVDHFALFCDATVEADHAQIAVSVRPSTDFFKETTWDTYEKATIQLTLAASVRQLIWWQQSSRGTSCGREC